MNVARFCIAYGHWTIMVWGPTYLLTEKSIPFQSVGIVTSAYAIASIPAALILGKLSDRVGRRSLSIVVPLLFGLAAFSLINAKGWEAIVAALVFCGAASSIAIYPVMLAWAAEIVEARGGSKGMGATMGTFNLSGVISGAITPVLTGYIADSTGSLRGGFEFTAVLAIAGGVVAVFARDLAHSKK